MISIINPEQLSTRRQTEKGTARQEKIVKEILAEVKKGGDSALIRYTQTFDGANLQELQVSAEEFDEAYQQVPQSLIDALRQAAQRIRCYHERQKSQSWMVTETEGTVLGQLIRPLTRVGIYVPGGVRRIPRRY